MGNDATIGELKRRIKREYTEARAAARAAYQRKLKLLAAVEDAADLATMLDWATLPNITTASAPAPARAKVRRPRAKPLVTDRASAVIASLTPGTVFQPAWLRRQAGAAGTGSLYRAINAAMAKGGIAAGRHDGCAGRAL